MTALETRGLSKAFGSHPIFDDVTLRLLPGRAMAIMGPSGSGKTTLLRCLNGLESADRGSVIVGPTRLEAGDSPHARQQALRVLRRQVGFVFQGCHLFSHRTVLENVMEGPLFVKRETQSAARSRAEALLDRLGVLHRAHAYPRALSGGEQQRTAIARALALEPAVLLLDEPTSALDAARGDHLAELLTAWLADGLSILTATHDAQFVKALGAGLLRLEGGRLLTDDG
jgi:ABC-type polar amino acid transport system ATPase subunit